MKCDPNSINQLLRLLARYAMNRFTFDLPFTTLDQFVCTPPKRFVATTAICMNFLAIRFKFLSSIFVEKINGTYFLYKYYESAYIWKIVRKKEQKPTTIQKMM